MSGDSAGWSGDNETRKLQTGDGSSGTRPGTRHVFTGMATTHKPAPSPAWAGDGATRPASGSTTAADPQAQPTPVPRTGRTTRITALLSPGGRRGPLSGAVWPDYELGDLLGQGGMGAVYRARQISVDRVVALKVLPAHLANDADLRRRFEIEARASSTLASPHIVQVYGAGVHDGQLYFAMEFVAGQSLAELAKARRADNAWFALTETLGYVVQVVEALRVAGAAGVVHRDIKPANCMVAADGTVKLADFGIAKILGEDGGTLTGTAMGTPSYLSPEQARGDDIDPRSDLYSLGIMLYELATGRLPYVGGSPDALIYQHSFTEPPLPKSINKDISADLQAVILKLIQKDPAARYPDAKALLSDLGRITGGMAPEIAVFVGRKLGTGADAALARIGGWRRRALWAAAAIVASSAALGGGWWWWDARKSEIAALRAELAPLDEPKMVPPGAEQALERLARLSGPADPYVVRWREDLARTSGMERELQRLEKTERPDLQAAELTLIAYEKETGSANPLVQQWRERVAAMRLDLAGLRGELAQLDAVDTATAAQEAALTPRLERYLRLAPEGDGDGQRWGAALERSRATIAALRTGLAVLDQAPRPADLPTLAIDLARLEALAGAEDADGRRWRSRFDEAQRRVAAWRANFARLDDPDLPDAVAVAGTAVDLAAWAKLAGEDDPELRRWNGAIRAAADRRQQLATRLGGIGDGILAAARLDGLAEEITAYRRLAGIDDADGQRWAAVVAATRTRIATWRAQLDGLDARSTTLSREDQRLARAALEGLRACDALTSEVEARWVARLSSDEARIAVLASGLAVLDRVGSPPVATAAWLTEYERLVGADDAQAAAWRARLDRIEALRGRLGVLDQQRPLPDGATADLGALADLVGSSDAQIVTWRGKLERCAALVRALSALDRVQPPFPEAAERLGEYRREVGDDAPEVRRWAGRLQRIAALQTRLDGLDRRLLPDPGATAACTELTGLIGAPATAGLRLRLAEIAGPARPSWAADGGEDGYGRWIATDLGGPRLRLRWIPCGTVRLGSPADEAGRDTDEDAATVTLTRGFWQAERECSQAEWHALMATTPALHRGDALPVERVSWEQAQAFCVALGARLGDPVRLPSEAEWEHAARAGTAAATRIGPQGALGADALDRVAVFASTAPIVGGQRLPNPLGLFDLHGNVWEWCQDGYAAYPVRTATDHVGSGPLKVIRGGSWGDGPQQLRLANRQRVDPAMRSPYLGFRVVVEGGALVEAKVAPVYRVQAGDTLTRIAERLLGGKERWRDLARWNPRLEVAKPLRVGQELTLQEQP
jgi:hypothetical protein